MPTIHVCSLAAMPQTVEDLAASHVLTLISPGSAVPMQDQLGEGRHLYIPVHDIWEPMDGHVMPDESHVQQVIDFAKGWTREQPLIVHCFAGVSRSTAAAITATLVVDPDRDPYELLRHVRRRSPTATPNPEIIRIADRMLGLGGKLVEATAAIGQGEPCYEGVPFAIEFSTEAERAAARGAAEAVFRR
jgi:predicted protein tyrosine phosphatase